MVRNVKIDDETHKKLSIRASELVLLKGDLASALIEAALENLPPETVVEYIRQHADRFRDKAKKGYPNRG